MMPMKHEGEMVERLPEEPGEVFKNELGPNRKARRKQQKLDARRAKREARYKRMLETANVPMARIFWHEHHHRAVDDHELLTALHGVRLTYPGISDELRAESGRWLARNKRDG